jgi:hypothetical protein
LQGSAVTAVPKANEEGVLLLGGVAPGLDLDTSSSQVAGQVCSYFSHCDGYAAHFPHQSGSLLTIIVGEGYIFPRSFPSSFASIFLVGNGKHFLPALLFNMSVS